MPTQAFRNLDPSDPRSKPEEEEREPGIEDDDDEGGPEPLHEFPDKKGEDPDGRPPSRMNEPIE